MNSDEEEDFVQYGTPLEPLEEDDFAPKKPRNDQTVRDEKGRRRFHGAFTGGFSAGYFNTVSTKEGWAPSAFMSSRVKKADQVQQRPEDFMDDEDFGEYGIAPRRVQLASKFSDESKETGKKRAFVENEGPIPGTPPLKDLIKPVNESIGVRLLQKMGWRPGQGIGPRIKRKEKSAPEGKKVYGCMLPPIALEDEDDPYALAFTFAPEDVSILTYTPKDNLHGIGYKGLDRTLVLSSGNFTSSTSTKAIITKDNRKLAIRGQAFGVGAFEDDDEDIYSKEDMTMYDFALDDGLKHPSIEKHKNKDRNTDVGILSNALEGFHLARQKRFEKKYFAPPLLPPDFRPLHKSTEERKRLKSLGTEIAGNKFLNRHAMTADQRGSLLGEKFRSGPPSSSVFNLISSPDKERLEEMHKKQEQTTIEEVQPTLESIKAGTFKPFARDLEKQKRYETYLAFSNAGRKDALQTIQPSTMTEWEKQREKAEFQRAALLYRPLSSALNTRFVSSSTSLEEEDKVEVPISEEGDKSDQVKAAEMKLFGKLTREKFPWHPSSLLCKRFNVPNPYPDSTLVGLPKVKKDKFSIFNFLTVEKTQSSSNQSQPSASTMPKEDKSAPEPVSSLITAVPTTSKEKHGIATDKVIQIESKPEGTTERPPLDLFKAIFASSSEESDSDAENKTEKIAEPVPKTAPLVPLLPPPSSTQVEEKPTPLKNPDSCKPPTTQSRFAPIATSGVFANLDLDAINSKPPSSVDITHSKSSSTILPIKCTGSKKLEDNLKSVEVKSKNESEKSQPKGDEFYGPKLPPGLIQGTNVVENSPRKQEMEYRQEHRHSKHKHKKKSSKKKKKHKHRKEGRRRKEQGSGSETEEDMSSNSDDDETSTHTILEKLKQLKRRL